MTWNHAQYSKYPKYNNRSRTRNVKDPDRPYPIVCSVVAKIDLKSQKSNFEPFIVCFDKSQSFFS